MAMKDSTVVTEPHEPRTPGMGWPIAIGIGTSMIAGGFLGYNQAAAEHGHATLPVWAGPLIAIALGAAALLFYYRRHAGWFRSWSPRKRLYWISIYLSGAIGLVLAILMTAGGGATMILGGALTRTMAIMLSLLWLVGMTVAMTLFHRNIDDHEREAYNIGALWGFYAFVLPCPVWWVLARADLVPPVDAMLLFLLSVVANGLGWMWFKFR